MDTNRLLDYLPAIFILLSVMTLAIIILTRFGNKMFDKDYSASNIFLFISAFLFIILLIVHLFKQQEWTADLLKVLVGVLVGAGTTKITKKDKGDGSSVDISGGHVGGDVAGRDINKNIQNLKDAVSNIKDSIIHQNSQINQVIGDSTKSDILINTVYERGDKVKDAIARVIRYWSTRGWQFKHFSSDYNGMDGIFLVFTKQTDTNPQVYYHHGADTSRFEKGSN